MDGLNDETKLVGYHAEQENNSLLVDRHMAETTKVYRPTEDGTGSFCPNALRSKLGYRKLRRSRKFMSGFILQPLQNGDSGS